MTNTTLTHTMVAREAAAILAEESPFVSNVNRARQDEFGEAVNGYKKGATVKVKIPGVGAVFDGATFAGGGSATDSEEKSIDLTLDTQKHVALQFSATEKLLSLTDFKERILRPQMRMLASVVEADLLSKAVLLTPNLVGTAGSVPTTMKTYAQARAKLNQFLAPPGDRSMIFSSNANTELVDASKALFNTASQGDRMFIRGSLGEAQGADFYEHQSIPSVTNGSQVASLLVNGVPSEGASSIAIDTGTGTNTIKKGSVFTIAGVYRVHPLTGTASVDLQQFVVTADLTLAAGAGTLAFYPALDTTAPNKRVSALPADNAAITFIGSASTAYAQNLMFHKDAFTAAFAPLPVLASCEGYTARLPNGISVRVMTFGDGNNDYERTRIDVLYGFAGVRPLHACRVTE
jgi:hypothetical protein